ncbi:hypothetical protein DFA_06517 [Cavenderia fasciculata]|uniref:Profilin n=1 Tax=Cavenderia fasciculata TaxID=261658 RepID=F4PJ81_CACFS|nr:uncharacterized protein DFA_06517 [Cavenderia fasciculata]EGG24367.1 hypothetical protein DFA_06517 [Cavenderia fasciculata]|eukprot:XP_004362218.1 hypothetical protein DFA_06517 [Cavenderia fasciculata]
MSETTTTSTTSTSASSSTNISPPIQSFSSRRRASTNNSNSTSPTLNVDLINKLASQPVPIIMPPSYKPEAKYEKYVNQLVGKVIMSAALISKTPGPKLKNNLLAQKGILIKFNETIQIVDAIAKGKLHLELISISGTKYAITTVKERSFYGFNTNTNIGGGIILIILDNAILVALFPASVLIGEAVPFIENYVSNTIIT